MIVGFGLLGLAWLAVIGVDILNLWGAGDRLYERMGERSATRAWAWVMLFSEGGPIEMLQWLTLALAAATAFMRYGRLSPGAAPGSLERSAALFWLLMGGALMLMVLEDAGNMRHWLRDTAYHFLGGRSPRYVELLYFGALACVPLSALLLFGRSVLRLPRTRLYLLGGFACYGLAAGGSAFRYRLYEPLGHWLHHGLLNDALRVTEVGGHSHYFWLMDFLVEESLELAGATLLAAAALQFGVEFARQGGRDRGAMMS
ncbi:hypothetical protein HOP52_18600 [Halomonas campisalis]|uniref:Uncharacterized protein n=1 Tax=Billgrantia campisalis TaxID=74661 RepID=A0ABS9PDD3_9GAMM|nr:hypothetical protein [Halomonas campisalis]MCG6659763.1 hypothetical protein [Halomonas campisalis]MDR5864920.1 hypothetical protein [Halomonas campisalis]